MRAKIGNRVLHLSYGFVNLLVPIGPKLVLRPQTPPNTTVKWGEVDKQGEVDRN